MSERLKPSGIISDVDNTIIATSSFFKEHINRTCQRLKIMIPSADEITKVLRTNPAFEDVFNQLFGEAKGPEVLEAYREDAPQYDYQPTARAVEFISLTDELKIPVVIVTNRVRMIEDRLKQAGFTPESFEDIVSLDFPKPDQHAYDSAIRSLINLGAKREKIVFIGDHPDDFLAVPDDLRKNFYAVLSGLSESQEFEELGLPPNNILSNLEGLIDKIRLSNG
ncbi:hypothetical protein A2Z41_03025 [Microgenomates group bacterium RBG_19FT_COMBO_39_10]|nr:MAG: hypothetical protein A2Z41_03025 [Microgenomates group bacterium RBG_19FT_COMBO_39_10]